jgi:hypothetical protein
VFQRDLIDPDFVLKQREEIDPKSGLSCGSDVRPPIANVHVLQCDEQAWEEIDSQTPADFDFHPHNARDGRFEPGLEGVDIQKKKQGDRGEDEQSDKGADGKTDIFK